MYPAPPVISHDIPTSNYIPRISLISLNLMMIPQALKWIK
jgi:hypothetical protein